MTTRTCQVRQCRFSDYHTTEAHKCGTCKEFGHGQTECNDNRKVECLRRYDGDVLHVSKHCAKPGCSNPETHTTEGHNCFKCGKSDHGSPDCIIQSLDDHIVHFNLSSMLQNFKLRALQNFQGVPIVVPIAIGMGCGLHVRYKDGEYTSLFMHSDSHGQYGPTTDDTPILNKFMEGCQELPVGTYCTFGPGVPAHVPVPKTEIMCPLCRTENSVETEILDLKGATEECKVCMDSTVEKFFSKCGHACVCAMCLEVLVTGD